LYLSNIKIQNDIDQNAVKKFAENHIFLKIIFEEFNFFWAGPSSAHMAGLDPAGLTGSLAQASDPAGKTKGTLTRACLCNSSSHCSSEL
jgi:hypothetical protein